MSLTVNPVVQKERIDILDSLRGVAILGILLMNIPSFSFFTVDPITRNEIGTINYPIWRFVTWVADGTQRALFSMLFGAGILLFMQSKEKARDIISASDYFFRRQLWLIFFGLINIYIFLWHGDILFDYGVYGLLIFVFRTLSPKKLLITAGVCLLLMLARENRNLYLDKRTIARGEVVMKLDTTVVKLTDRQKEHIGNMEDFKKASSTETKIKRVKRANRMMGSTHEEIYEYRVERYFNNLLNYSYFGIWDVLLFMFIGMAFFKLGIVTGNASVKLYAVLCTVGLSLGLLISYYDIQPMIDAKFNRFDYTKQASLSFFELGRTFRSLGFFGLLMLMFKSGVFQWFFKLMKPVGQMAFTNYLTQSIACAIIFYGFGFGFYGQLERYEVYIIVLCIWLVQIAWSHVWLRYFQYGPFEWMWRQLTYWKRLSIKN
jgi:uncharacterized protein